MIARGVGFPALQQDGSLTQGINRSWKVDKN